MLGMNEQNPDDKLTIDELERQHGWMIKNLEGKASKKIKRSEFLEMVDDPDIEMVGIHHESREAWLKSQGYEITRENMVNTDLTSKG